MQKMIVDAYNVIYTDDRLRRTACKDLERARERLVRKLERYLAEKRLEITLVFDGRGRIADRESFMDGRLHVVYSAGPGTADDFIVSALEQDPNPSSYIVVTSDMADIGRTARALGARVIGSKRFLERISASEGAVSVGGEDEKPDPNRVDMDYWLDRFSDEETEGPESSVD